MENNITLEGKNYLAGVIFDAKLSNPKHLFLSPFNVKEIPWDTQHLVVIQKIGVLLVSCAGCSSAPIGAGKLDKVSLKWEEQ